MVRKRRRNAQAHEMLQFDHPAQRDPRVRSLYVVARPIRKMGRLKLSFLSDGSYPFCHWGLFISPHNENDLLKNMLQQSQSIHEAGYPGLGTMVELQQSPQGNKPNVISDFQICSWEQAVFAYSGETEMSDEEIVEHGMKEFILEADL